MLAMVLCKYEKTVFVPCEQQMRRSDCACAQSGQRLCGSLLGKKASKLIRPRF